MLIATALGFTVIFVGLIVFVTGLGQSISFGTPQYMIIGIILIAGGIIVNRKYGRKK